jgi:DtxR family transcriptional regulator, Mn-dependent transcriptional regulator
MASQTEENYLKSLLLLTNQNEVVSVSKLSSLLNVSRPTVNSMVKRLKKQGLMNYEKYKPLSLTAKGKLEALHVIRKHRLSEMYLKEKMGFGWEEVHEIAEQLEHIDSPDLFARMDALLGFPQIDPHGSPIPDKNGKIARQSHKQLSKYKKGDHVRVVALAHDSSDFLTFLNNHELQLGTELEIKSIEIFDSSMVVNYKNHSLETLSKIICDRLLVERLKP